MTTLEKILCNTVGTVDIEVRCIVHFKNGETDDMLVGMCQYENGHLFSLDGDTYSLRDRVYDWSWDENGDLTVWDEWYE